MPAKKEANRRHRVRDVMRAVEAFMRHKLRRRVRAATVPKRQSSTDRCAGSSTEASDSLALELASLSLELEATSQSPLAGSQSSLSSTSSTSTSTSSSSSTSESHSSSSEASVLSFLQDKQNATIHSIPTPGSSILGNTFRYVRNEFNSRYQVERRNRTNRPPPTLPYLLDNRYNGTGDFCDYFQVSPSTFDRLVNEIGMDAEFTNNSHHLQAPAEFQIALVLYRFGHYGNAVMLSKVAAWAGIGKGTVESITRQVLRAVLKPSFKDKFLRPPTTAEKEKAKDWVEEHSCQAWHDGWCMVDGTLVTLYHRPYWFGESYFDRKSRYSLNFQIVNLPNKMIIDVGYGHTGSCHDSTAWEQTRIYQEHKHFFTGKEFIWADSAYPLQQWLIAPYKKPLRDLPENEEFNMHLSMIQIQSEHAIGFLKGRFKSLKGLRIRIIDEKSHRFATYWVLGCIVLHCFAMQCELEEDRQESEDSLEDTFVQEGLSDDSEGSDDEARLSNATFTRLTAGKKRREELKKELKLAKAKARVSVED